MNGRVFRFKEEKEEEEEMQGWAMAVDEEELLSWQEFIHFTQIHFTQAAAESQSVDRRWLD